MDGFVMIPRALLTGGAWQKANDKQRVAMVTLCSVVTNREFVYHSDYGDLKLEAGQMVTSLGRLAVLWNVSKDKARWMLDFWKKHGELYIEKPGNGTFIGNAPHSSLPSILTIKSLHDRGAPSSAPEQELNNKNQNKKEKNNIKKEQFVPPTVDEVQEYLDRKGIVSFTAREFIDYYEQGGWVYGSHHTPVKNWKACVTTWVKNGKKTHINGNSETNIYSNGIAGRNERLRRAAQSITERLSEAGGGFDQEFDF